MKKILYITAAFLTIAFSSCESEQSILDSQGFGGSVEEIQDFVGVDTYDKFSGILGVPIYEGNNPPLVNGEYNIFQILQTADAIDPNSPANGRILGGVHIKIELSNQDIKNGRIYYTGSFWGTGADGVPDTSDDAFLYFDTAFSEVFISGSALPDGTGGFNLFLDVELDGTAQTVAISGFKTSDGITDLTYAFVSYDDNNTIDAGKTWKDENGFSPSL
jgi:hypothetical protein